MDIKTQLDSIREELVKELAAIEDIRQLEEVRQKVLGKKGSLTALLRSMGSLSPEERPIAGQLINKGREEIGALIDERMATLKAKEREEKLKKDTIDVTEPRELPRVGVPHPTSLDRKSVV